MAARLARSSLLRAHGTVSSPSTRPLLRTQFRSFHPAPRIQTPFSDFFSSKPRSKKPAEQEQEAQTPTAAATDDAAAAAASSQPPQTTTTTSDESPPAPADGSTPSPSALDDAVSAYNATWAAPSSRAPAADTAFGSSWSAPPPRKAAGGPSSLLDVSAMMDFSRPSGTGKSDGSSEGNKRDSAGLSAAFSAPPPALAMRIPKEAYPVLNSRVGREVAVDERRGVDFNRAVARLGMLVAREGIRRTQFRQRFHERPGLKKKRLRMERWRKRFKAGFQATVSRVVRLKKQGW